jgi:hypothetical protein
MAGRGENNKHGSAGQGSSNQSNQPFIKNGENQPRSNSNKKQTGVQPSIPEERSIDDRSGGREEEKSSRSPEKSFNILVDEVPYLVKSSPFTFNGETRFYVNVNGGGEHVFTWDSELGRLRAIDDTASTLPEAVEEAISHRLEAMVNK